MTEHPMPSPPGTRWGLKTKVILSMLLVGLIPLIVGLGMAFWQGSQEIREVSGESFEALATEAARKLDLLLAEEIAHTALIANDPMLIRELEHRRDARGNAQNSTTTPSDLERRWIARDRTAIKSVMENPFSALLHEYFTGVHSAPGQLLPHVVRSSTKMLFLTDVQGMLVATMTEHPVFRHHESRWWQGAFNKAVGRLYIEDIRFDDRVNAYVFTISLPVMDSLRYEVVGILHRVIDAKEFFSPSTHVIRFGKTGHVMLIDTNGIVISCPLLPTGVPLSDRSLIPLVTPQHPGWVQASSDGHGGQDTSVIGFAPLHETSRAINSNGTGSWHTFVWQSSDELFAPIQHLFTWVTAFGAVALVLLASLGYIAAGRIVTPVRQLQQAAQAIGRGELRTPIQIDTGDELEDLAEEFNRMNSQLKAAFAGLTDQVKLKTQEVQVLRQSTDQILDAVPTPILLIDAQEVVRYINQAGRESFKVQEPMTGTSLFTILPLDPAVQKRLQAEFHTTNGNSALTTDTVAPETMSRDPLTPSVDHKSAEPRAELHIGSRIYQYQWFRLPTGPGEEDSIGLVLRDTTDESRLQDQLVQAEKTGSLGVLTAGIGHELNNPLFGIIGLGEVIQDEQDLEHIKNCARDIVAHGRRMATIIRDFAGVINREASDKPMLVLLEQVLDQALATAQTTVEMKDITVHKTYAGNTPVSAFPDQLRQALVNLVTNAAQAMQGAGTLTLTTLVSNQTATVTIVDTGPGIARQHLTRIFDPFFTTKGQGEGSGLGLTVARRIIRKLGGDLRIESAEGRGTACIITLPTNSPLSPEGGPWTTDAAHTEPEPSHSS